MRIIKDMLIVFTILLCLFVIWINFFLKSAVDEASLGIYFLLIMMCIVIIYHYKSYACYDEKVLKRFDKYVVFVLSLCALGFNFYVMYATFFYLFDKMINFYGSFLDIFEDSIMFLFGLFGVIEIILLRSKMKKVEENNVENLILKNK